MRARGGGREEGRDGERERDIFILGFLTLKYETTLFFGLSKTVSFHISNLCVY